MSLTVNNNIKRYNVEKLKVGVISDSQITPCFWKEQTVYEKNLIDSLLTFKDNNCNLIIFAGDICNKASKSAYERYINCYKKVFGDNMPIVQHVMGNHDYLYGIASKRYYRNLFNKSLEQEPFSHIVINGYHFIGASPCSSNMYDAYRPIEKWLHDNIKLAIEEDSSKPVFITTHNAPKNTVYGSDDWGDVFLGKIFEKYPQIINFSGHSHYSLLDKRSCYIGDFTALCTQSVSYIEMEKGKQNGTIPPMAFNYPMGYIIDISENEVIARKFDLKRNVELQSKAPLQLYPRTEQKYVESKPVFSNTKGRYELVNDLTQLEFDEAQDDSLIHSYKVVINDNIVQYYFSDFYMGADSNSPCKRITLYNLKRGFYNVKIYAQNDMGFVSENYIEIDNVPIIKKAKYRKIQTPEKITYRF